MATRQVGETVQLGAAVKDANGDIIQGETITWSSQNSSVASVSSSGLVTALALGIASVSAAAGGQSGSAVITVAGTPVATITVAPTTDTILVNESVQLAATLRDDQGQIISDQTVSWSTSMASVATVSADGLVSGVADGTVTITASADGKSAQAMITVWGPCAATIAPAILVGESVQGELASTDCPLDDNSYADGYYISVANDTEVQLDMTSASFDTWLWLLELLSTGELQVVAFNDDVAEGNTDSQIVFTLLAGVEYFILANSFDPETFGPYELTVTEVAPGVRRLTSPRLKPGKAPLTRSLRVTRPR